MHNVCLECIKGTTSLGVVRTCPTRSLACYIRDLVRVQRNGMGGVRADIPQTSWRENLADVPTARVNTTVLVIRVGTRILQ